MAQLGAGSFEGSRRSMRHFLLLPLCKREVQSRGRSGFPINPAPTSLSPAGSGPPVAATSPTGAPPGRRHPILGFPRLFREPWPRPPRRLAGLPAPRSARKTRSSGILLPRRAPPPGLPGSSPRRSPRPAPPPPPDRVTRAPHHPWDGARARARPREGMWGRGSGARVAPA